MASPALNSSDEEGWKIAARRGFRDEKDLEKHGLEPVWTSWGGYPGRYQRRSRNILTKTGKEDLRNI
ncbi:hypothetical protein AWENTII_000857 [Aspergillus wentii]